jgi:hypothetical protein
MDTGGSGTPPPRPPPCSPRPPTAPSTSPSCLSGSTGPTVRDSILVILRSVLSINLFLFIRGLSCPGCIQTSLSLNCLKLTTEYLDFLTTHKCLLVSCGDIGFFKQNPRSSISLELGLKVLFLPLVRSCPLQTIMLSDLVGCDSPLQIVMAFWCTITVSRGLSHPTQ